MNFNNKFIRVTSEKELKIILLILRSFEIYKTIQIDSVFKKFCGWQTSTRILFFRHGSIDLTIQDYSDEYLLSQQLNKFTLEELLDYDSKK